MLSNDTTSYPPPTTGTYTYNTFKPGASGFPALGGTYTDPVFGASNTDGSIIMRYSAVEPGIGFSNIYAHHWSNADGTLMFEDSTAFVTNIRYTSDASIYKANVPIGEAGGGGPPSRLLNQEMEWDPLRPDVYYRCDTNQIIERTLATGVDVVVHTFATNLNDRGASHSWTSGDGNIFVVNENETIKVFNRSANVVYTGTFTPQRNGGYTTISPDGKYVIDVGGNFRSYALDHTAHTMSTTAINWCSIVSGDHAGILTASNGITYGCVFPFNSPFEIWALDVSRDQSAHTDAQCRADGTNHSLMSFDINNDAGHFTCGIIGSLQDWLINSQDSVDDTYNSGVGSWRTYKSETRAVNVITGEIRRFFHHRSRSTANYQAQTRASISWDGSFLSWISNYNDNVSASNYNDMYGTRFPFGATETATILTLRPSIMM